MTQSESRPEEEVVPSAPVPARTERRVNTSEPRPQPGSGPEDMGESERRLPHERDQSVDMTGGEPDAQVEQAYRDVQRGLQDTDRGPPAHKAYQKQKK